MRAFDEASRSFAAWKDDVRTSAGKKDRSKVVDTAGMRATLTDATNRIEKLVREQLADLERPVMWTGGMFVA